MTTTTTHRAHCNDHLPFDDDGICSHRLEPVEDFEVSVALDFDPENKPILINTDMDELTASEARRIAYALLEAANLVDSAALPEGKGQAVTAEHVALMADVREFDVRDAMNRGELPSHKAVDGSGRLLVAWDDATAWARARREA